MGLACEFHCDFFTRIRLSPNWNDGIALEHHLVCDDRRQGDVRKSGMGDADGKKAQRKKKGVAHRGKEWRSPADAEPPRIYAIPALWNR